MSMSVVGWPLYMFGFLIRHNFLSLSFSAGSIYAVRVNVCAPCVIDPQEYTGTLNIRDRSCACIMC
jgi:hypothetical protein